MASQDKDFSNFKNLYQRKFSDVVGSRTLSNSQLFHLVTSYFEWAENNPLNTPETANFQGRVYQGEAKKIRPFTITSLCLYLNVTPKSWREWKGMEATDEEKERVQIIEFAESIIREQKYSAAMVGTFNPQFVMKDLDMDVSTVKSIGDPNSPIHHEHGGNITLDSEAIQKLVSKL